MCKLVVQSSLWYNTSKGFKMILEQYPKYEILRDGRVISLNYNNTNRKQEVKPQIKRGYEVVGITNKDGKRVFVGVHRLVSMAYIPNLENKREVNHIDGNKLNNNVSNLEWVTSSENQKHAFKIGLQKAHSCNMNGNYQGEKCIHSKLTEDIVISCRERYKNGEKVSALAKEHGVSKNSMDCAIYKNKKIRTWKHLPYPY